MTITTTIDLGKTLIVIGVLIAVVCMVLLIRRTLHWLRRIFRGRQFREHDKTAMQERWREVQNLMEQKGEVSIKLAIIEADKLLDNALKSLAMPGTSLGERLKFASYKYPKLSNVWWAHKIRNRLVHETAFGIDRGLAKKAIAEFERALKLIGAI